MPHLGKCKRVWNETWFKVGWQMLMREVQKTKNHNPVLPFTYVLIFVHKMFAFFVMSWYNGVGLQVLPFIDNRHLWSIPCFRRFPCLNCRCYCKIFLAYLRYKFISVDFIEIIYIYRILSQNFRPNI